MTDIVTHNDRIATIGMDLGKRSFHLIGMDARGKVIMRQSSSIFKRCIGFAAGLSGTAPLLECGVIVPQGPARLQAERPSQRI